jgi:phosphate:Na+ symporter
MDFFSLLSFVGGLGLFLYGMKVLGEAIGRQAGGRLKLILERITANRLAGVLLGAVVTIVIQSSGATTVMLIGFINSGIMSLGNAIGPILGANIGTTVTGWLLALNDISGESFLLRLLNPDSFVPLLAFLGAFLLVFCKRDRLKDIGVMILGFAVLMFGMSEMTDAMSPLRDSALFRQILQVLSEPIFGVAAGFAMAAILQSSSASVGIVQAAAVTGVISIGNALPLIMGINIGAGIIVLVASTGTNRDAKRAAWVYMLYNLISTAVCIIPLYLLRLTLAPAFLSAPINSFDIALLHTIYKLVNTFIQLPFFNQIIWLTRRIVKPQAEEQMFALLDENFLKTPSIAVARCSELTNDMAQLAGTTLNSAIEVVMHYDESLAQSVRELEGEIDVFEDKIGNYLVKLSGAKLSAADSKEVSRMLHGISDLERMSDHARNIMESGVELHEKGLHFSGDAQEELVVLCTAVKDITERTITAFVQEDRELAFQIDPLEQVVDDLTETMRSRHIDRLKNGQCSTTLGFVFTDLLTDLERVSDHCSNISVTVLQMGRTEFEPHSYEAGLKYDNPEFKRVYAEFQQKYQV